MVECVTLSIYGYYQNATISISNRQLETGQLLSTNIYKDVTSSAEPTTSLLYAYSKSINDDSCSPNVNNAIVAAVSGISLSILAVFASLLALMRRRIRMLESKLKAYENQTTVSVELENKDYGQDNIPSEKETTQMQASSAYGLLPGKESIRQQQRPKSSRKP
jgi:hypothetical protein